MHTLAQTRSSATAPQAQQRFEVSASQRNAIAAVPHFREGAYGYLPVEETLDFYRKRYVQQLANFRAIDASTVIADVGAGYGWLAMAFAAFSPAQVIAIEMDAGRLQAGRQIATILGLSDRITWVAQGLGEISLADRSVDVAYCIEVLEHVQCEPKTVVDLARLPRDLLILTTPNQWVPVIAHDTRLPFCHWLPLSARNTYARAFKRDHIEHDNLFWSPRALDRLLTGFEPVANFLHYKTLDDYVATYPFHLPYLNGGHHARVGGAKLAYYKLAALLGPASRFIMPNLAMVWQRKR